MAAVAVGLLVSSSTHGFEVNSHRRRIRGLSRPLRVSLLTDFHLGPHLGVRELEAWVEASNQQLPDLVLLGGDLVDQHYRGDLSELKLALSRLGSRLGVYAVLGNHDRTRYRNLSPLRLALEEAGVDLLVNEGRSVRDDLYLAGLDDYRVGQANVGAALAREPEGDAATVLLSHNPDVIPELPGGIDLVLSGHTHGGQIRLPFLGPLVTSSEYGARFAEGWVRAQSPAFVSRGLGVTAIPVRFNCPAEVVVLDLEPA